MNKEKFQLWFFKDLTDEQRLKLFRINGLPVGESMTLGHQQAMLNYLFTQKEDK